MRTASASSLHAGAGAGRRCRCRALLLALACLLLSPWATPARAAEMTQVHLLQVIPDRQSSFSLAEVTTGRHDHLGLTLRSSMPSLGYVRHPHWIRLRLVNGHDREVDRVLVLLRGSQHEQRFWRLDTDPPAALPVQDSVGPHSLLPLRLPPGQPIDLLVWIDSRTAVVLDFRLLEAAELAAHERFDHAFAGLLLGVALMTIMLVLALVRASRDRGHLWFAAFTLLGASYHLHTSGMAYPLFWPAGSKHWAAAVALLSASAAVACLVGYYRWFLDLPRHYPKLDRRLLRPFLALPLLPLVLLPNAWWLANASNAILAVVAFVLLIVLATRSQRVGVVSTPYFLLGTILFMASSVPYLLVRTGLVAGTSSVSWMFQGTWALAVAGFVMAIAERMRLLDRETRRLQRQNAQQLEALVHSRTAELHSAKEAAEAALAQLQETQLQLVQAEKMASLGTLTAGVAHEINNPTNFADGAVQQLAVELQRLHDFLRQLAGNDAPQEVLAAFAERFERLADMTATAREGHERIKLIVRDLRQFTRLDEAERKRIHISEPIRSTVNLIRTRFDGIDLELDLDIDPEIECQPAKLGQAFMNLIVNACEAAQCRRGDGRGWARIATAVDRDQAVVHIVDNGQGMDAATRQRIFDPFFTTKSVGAGTGLGLSITLGIVRDHGGDIRVESVPGQGSRFLVTLPLAGGTRAVDR